MTSHPRTPLSLLLLGLLPGCSERNSSSAPTQGLEVIHLIDRMEDVTAVESPLTRVQMPSRVHCTPRFDHVSKGYFATYLPWPAAGGTLRVLDGERVLERRANRQELLRSEGYTILPSEQRLELESMDKRNTDGQLVHMQFTHQEPAHRLLHDQQYAAWDFDVFERRSVLKIRAKNTGEAATLEVILDEMSAGELEIASSDWTTYELPLGQRLGLTLSRLVAKGSVHVDWMAVDTLRAERILVRSRITDTLALDYLPVAPNYTERLTYEHESKHAVFAYFSGGPVELRLVGSARSVLVDSKPLTQISAGRFSGADLEPGLRTIEIDGPGGEFDLVQPLAQLLPYFLDPNLRLADDTGDCIEPTELERLFLARLDCRSDRRAALWLPSDSLLEFETTLEAGDRLRFSVGGDTIVGPEPTEEGVEFRVVWTSGGGTESVLSRHTWNGGEWQDYNVSLDASLAGTGVLRFETRGGAGGCGALAGFADPRILRGREHATASPPNVIVYLIDTVRADRLSCYGGPNPTSPNLQKLADEGYLFEQCYAAASWTRPSTASILTGYYPVHHRALGKDNALPGALLTLAESFRGAGYSTWGCVSNVQVAARGLNFEQGFHRFVTAKGFRHDSGPGLSSLRINDTVFPWLEEHKAEPFFLYLHSVDPHSPYAPPEGDRFARSYDGPLNERPLAPKLEFDEEFDRRLGPRDVAHLKNVYDAAIRYQDEQFGRLLQHLEDLGIRENTVIVVLSDHGEEFREHGEWEHGGRMWEELLRVPLIVSIPEPLREGLMPPGYRVKAPVSHVDLMPTLLDLLQVEVQRASQGSNLRGLLAGDSTLDRNGLPGGVVFSEERGNLGMLREGDHKLIWKKRVKKPELLQVFDLSADAGELNDLGSEAPELLENLLATRQALQDDLHRTGGELDAVAAQVTMSDEERETLRAMGYLDDEDNR